MSVANLKTKIMITAEEFFRNKIKEKNPNIEVVTLSRELITAEEGMRWAHEFKQLHLHAVISWVAVEEKMPESGQCVLLYSPKSGVGEGAWISAKGHFEQWRWNAILTNVSHWMPMPEPPCL